MSKFYLLAIPSQNLYFNLLYHATLIPTTMLDAIAVSLVFLFGLILVGVLIVKAVIFRVPFNDLQSNGITIAFPVHLFYGIYFGMLLQFSYE